jgi:glycosyltransferase involved in cell wall biosynthesis
MIKRIVIVHTDFRLYWPSRLKALNAYIKKMGDLDLSIVEVSGKGSPYSFDESGMDNSISWTRLFTDKKIEDINPKDIVREVTKKLDEIKPDIVLAGAMAFPAGAAGVRWGVNNNTPVVVFDNARLEDVPRAWYIDMIKKSLYSCVDAVLIPAPSHDPTYEYFGFSKQQIFYGLNCIDNSFFKNNTANADNPGLQNLNPMKPYLLALGRQVSKKNWKLLINAFTEIAEFPEMKSLNLAFIGDGPEHDELVSLSGNMLNKRIFFLPFKKQDEIVPYYTNAEALVLPSLYGETWGLVVNEAMAAGLPVLVSDRCGCSETLVKDGKNGYKYNPEKQDDIENILLKFASHTPAEKQEMGRCSEVIIDEWGLNTFCEGMWKAIQYVGNKKKSKGSLIGRVITNVWNGRYRPT